MTTIETEQDDTRLIDLARRITEQAKADRDELAARWRTHNVGDLRRVITILERSPHLVPETLARLEELTKANTDSAD